MIPQNVQVGAYVLCAIQGVSPASQAAGTRTGSPIDVSRFQSGVVVGNIAAAANTPTAASVTYSLESSADGTGGWAPVKDVDGVAVQVVADALAAKAVEVDVNLQWLPTGHTFIRVKEVVALTGGTSPTVVTGATLTLGGGQRLPV
ncbi:hypothetical protein DRW03_21265 [Corallococcus sp. H22C18031201]|nr:hypothetical protein DRW03_21265 [Corallococcus sp. H22C18031201]